MTALIHTSDDADQGTDAWRQHRAGSVTGTGFADVLTKLKDPTKESKTRQNYRLQLLAERITGQPAPEIYAPALAWGKENEDNARMAYEMHMAAQGTPVLVQRVGFQQHKTLDWVGTSPDGLVGDKGMLEIKCPFNSANHLLTLILASEKFAAALLGEKGDLIPVPPEHIPQIQGNLWVLERDWCDFTSFDPRVPEHLQLYVHRVYRDAVYIAKLEEAVKQFLDEVDANASVLLAA